MYAISIVFLVVRAAAQHGGEELVPRLRFRLRSLLVIVSAMAGLMALGSIGWVAVAVIAAGGALYALSWAYARHNSDQLIANMPAPVVTGAVNE